MSRPFNDPMRPSTQPPPTSWWAEKRAQEDRDYFAEKLSEQGPRQTAISPSYNKPQNGGRDV